MIEIWKDIKGFEGYFQVSNLGRVKKLLRVTTTGRIVEEKIMDQFTWQSRYMRVDIGYKENKVNHRRATYVHTLVAEAFIGDRPEGYVIDHINGDYLDNRAENLRYVTQSENIHNPNTPLGMLGKRFNDEEKEYISLKTKEAMKRPEVRAKLCKPKRKDGNCGCKGRKRRVWFDEFGKKHWKFDE